MTSPQAVGRIATTRSFWLGVAAYLVPTFPIAYAWHLVLFAPAYGVLGIYRPDPIIPFGFASMLIQGLAFSWAYPCLFPERGAAFLRPGLVYEAGACDSIVVVHHARRGCQEHHDLGTHLCPVGDGLYTAPVSLRRAIDRARLPKDRAK
jgi:hypothetical protein